MPDILRLRTQEAARFLNSHRVFFYSLLSILSVSAVITNALKNYSNFYSVAIYLSKSSRSVLVLANFGVLLTLLCGHIVQRIFFGSLRPNEVERLYDRLWFFITESLLAFTIFRDEFDTPFALMFGFLLFVKSFHWLASDRIEWMDQRPYPGPPLLFHFRMTILFAILWTTDCLMFLFAVEHTLSAGVGGMVLFASEYGILMASVMNTISKYLLSAYDLRRAGRRGGENAPPWENKSMWVFYIELATDFLKLTTYLIFFIIIIAFYGLPLNIVRDVYITARSFVTRLRALHRYQTATRNMDQRYPNATEEELTTMSDRTCIICREEMVLHGTQDPPAHPDGPNTTPKKLPCGHIFHFYCLRSWLERQQSCPTCRRNVLDNNTGIPAANGVLNAPAIPGAVPQQANAVAPADGQNAQGGNNPLNNFIARFFGPPARLANAGPGRPGQPNPNNAQGQVGGQQPGIFINYQVQYQFPRQELGPHNPQQPPSPLLAVPPFPGFPGPSGVWQPWPTGQEIPDDIQMSVLGEDASISSLPRQATVTSGLPEQYSPVTSAEAPTSGNSSPSGTSPSGSSSHESAQSPREAAALAALNRLQGKRPEHKSKESGSIPGQVEITQSDTSSASPSQTKASEIANQQVPPPHLIPLYDYRSHLSFPRPYVPRASSGQQQLPAGQPMSTPSLPNGTRPIRPPASIHSQNVLPQPVDEQNHATVPLSQLPPTLTAQQLANLDMLTRESIDERLRILEGVSGAVYRCIDDLMMLRSAIPPATTSSETSGVPPLPLATPHTPPNNGQNVGDASTSRGKEKMQEDDAITSTASGAGSSATENDPSHTEFEHI